MKTNKENNYRFVEAFSGPGGMSLGLSMAGFEDLFAFDYNKRAVETYNQNLSQNCVQADASKLESNEILERISLKRVHFKSFLDFATKDKCILVSKHLISIIFSFSIEVKDAKKDGVF